VYHQFQLPNQLKLKTYQLDLPKLSLVLSNVQHVLEHPVIVKLVILTEKTHHTVPVSKELMKSMEYVLNVLGDVLPIVTLQQNVMYV
jgi:hypothetical protein